MPEALVKSVKKALDALDFVVETSRSDSGASLGEIAAGLNEKLTTVRNILKTMEACDYIGRKGKLYIPGSKTGDLRRSANLDRLKSVSRPLLENAAQRTGESFVLTTVFHGKREIVSRCQGNNEVGVNIGVAEYKTVYSLVTTRIILAFSNEMERRQFINVNGLPGEEWPETVGDKFESGLALLKSVGVAIERKESFCAYAVPIFYGDENIMGAIGLFAPAFRVNEKREIELLAALSEAAENINKQF